MGPQFTNVALSVKWLAVPFRLGNALLQKMVVADGTQAGYAQAMHFRPLVFVAIACGLGFACGGGQKEPPSSATTPASVPEPVASSAAAIASSAEAEKPTPSVSATPSATVKAWKDKSPEERLAVMKDVVMPKMKTLFQEYDAKEFKDFSCATCHEDPKNKKFEMPNPKLPKLSFKDNLAKHQKKHPKMLEFMMKKVTPAMVEALNEQPYDLEKHTGFGCGGCHLPEK